jgi:hypothetical protein
VSGYTFVYFTKKYPHFHADIFFNIQFSSAAVVKSGSVVVSFFSTSRLVLPALPQAMANGMRVVTRHYRSLKT